ncbi:MAG: DUF3782 domain-containing protein, partial [Chthoniobacterales bacterium]
GQQIGGLGNKFGSFTEGMAYESVKRILREKFKMEAVTPQYELERNGEAEEYDILAYSNGKMNRGFIVEVKSQLDDDCVPQLEQKMANLFRWLPEHRGKVFEAMVAYVSGPTSIKNRIRKKGWHLAHIGEEVFKLENAKGFKGTEYRYEG